MRISMWLSDNQLNETQKNKFLENTSALAVSATGIASKISCGFTIV
jgi:hypothetical protein